jgi:hypothetical protein
MLRIAVVLPLLVAAACTTNAPPPSLTQAAQAVSAAEAQGARQFAPTEMQVAADRLAAARSALDNDRYEMAARLADEAVINARLAQARMEDAQAQAALAEVGRPAAAPPVVVVPSPFAPAIVR